jgi:uncharacterized protein YciI
MYLAVFTSLPNSTKLRDATKPAHDEYWSTRMNYIRFAGPMLSDDGATRLGQIVVLDVEDHATASDILLNDPFTLAGLFTEVSIRRFRVSVDRGISQ